MSGQVAIDGQPEAAIEIREGLASGAIVLRGSVGSLRGGTRLVLSKAGAAAPAGSESAASGASPRP
jgi:hypothetical protein